MPPVFSPFGMFPQMMFHMDPLLLRLKGVIEDDSALPRDSSLLPAMDPGPLFLICVPPPAAVSPSFKLFNEIDGDDSTLSPQTSNLLLTNCY